MKVDSEAKAMSGVVAVLCGLAYLSVYAQHPIAEMLWGFTVFFACLSWFTEEAS